MSSSRFVSAASFSSFVAIASLWKTFYVWSCHVLSISQDPVFTFRIIQPCHVGMDNDVLSRRRLEHGSRRAIKRALHSFETAGAENYRPVEGKAQRLLFRVDRQFHQEGPAFQEIDGEAAYGLSEAVKKGIAAHALK